MYLYIIINKGMDDLKKLFIGSIALHFLLLIYESENRKKNYKIVKV